MVDMLTEQEIRNKLPQFTGTERWYPYGASGLLLTEGAKFVADACEAYWLLDLIASYQGERAVNSESFQVWRFKRSGEGATAPKDHPHRASMTDGDSDVPIVSQAISYTDFPLSEIELWAIAEGESRRVVLLPSEY